MQLERITTIKGGVCSAKGFRAAGVAAEIKYKGRDDVALVAADSPCDAAAVFTTNKVAAAALHAGGTIFDALPHGSFFHATAGSVGMSVRERLRIFPYGTLVGLTSTVVSSLMYIFYL